MSSRLKFPVDAGEQYLLDLRPGSAAGRKARLSRHAFLSDLQRVITRELERTSYLDDWIGQFLDTSDKNGTADAERLFCSYFAFCDAVGVRDEDRLILPAFARAMTERGFALVSNPGGRAFRLGCRLLRRKIDAPLFDPEPLVDQFLSECCEVGGGACSRVRSMALHEAYCEWARAHGAEPLTLRRLSESLRYRGFAKLHSNGIYWLSITLRSGVNDCPPAPRAAAECASEVENSAEIQAVGGHGHA